MRLIPGKTKVKIELFKGITLGDVVVVVIALALVTLVGLSSIPGRLYIALVILGITGILLFRLDEEPTYRLLINCLKFLSFPRRFFRVYDDRHMMAKALGTEKELYLQELEEKLTGKRLSYAELCAAMPDADKYISGASAYQIADIFLQ